MAPEKLLMPAASADMLGLPLILLVLVRFAGLLLATVLARELALNRLVHPC